MLSRVAESIYWMGRYIERAENVARIMDANYHMILDLPVGVGEQWEPLVVTTGDEELFKEYLRRFQSRERRPVPDLRYPQPQLDPLLPAYGQGERPLGA